MSARWNKEKSASVCLWREFRATVYEEELPKRQEIECSRAFYAGMMAAYSVIVQIGGADEDDETGAQRLEGLRLDIAQAASETIHAKA